MSIEIGNTIILSYEEFPDGWQIIGNYDEVLEDDDRITTAPIYLRIGDSIRLNLTVIPYLDQSSGVIIKIYSPEGISEFPEDRSYGIKTVNNSVILNASSTKGNYWFEVVNPGYAGGDEMRVSGKCFYYRVSTLPDPTTPYNAFQVGDWLIYNVDYQFDVPYTVTGLDPSFIQFEYDDPYTGWNTIIVPISYQPPFDDSFYSKIMDRNFLPFNYNLSTLEEIPVINPVFYDAETLVQTNSGIIITENIIINDTTIVSYITTIEYTIAELIPVKGVTWEYHTYNDTDETWSNYSVQLQVHEPTGIPIVFDMAVSETDYSLDQKFSYHLIDSHGVFETKEFPIEDITEYVYITEYVNVTQYINVTKYVTVPEYITITEHVPVNETHIIYITETLWVTKETIITKQTTDFVALAFIALAIVGIVVNRRRK
jgi:hypothetical protein